MRRAERAMIEKNLDLIFEFERYLLEHPEEARRIPDGAVVVMQVKNDQAFNRWTRRVGERQAKAASRPVIHVTISRMGPVRSRIEALRIERAA